MNSKTKLIHGLVVMSLLASAIPALAQTPPPSAGRSADTVDVACIQAAIDKRDNAIIAAVDTFHDAAKSALQTRRDALKAAWALTDRDARRKAIRSAWENYRKSVRQARQDLNKVRRAAWAQYKTDRRACGKGVSSDEGIGAGVDAQL